MQNSHVIITQLRKLVVPPLLVYYTSHVKSRVATPSARARGCGYARLHARAHHRSNTSQGIRSMRTRTDVPRTAYTVPIYIYIYKRTGVSEGVAVDYYDV